MKQLLQASAFFSFVLLISLNACQKDYGPDHGDPNPQDTTILKDSTQLPVPGKKVTVFVTKLGTNLPAAHYPVMLFSRFSSDFYPAYYLPYDSLGMTDDQGKFIWDWKGDTLPDNIYMGFSLSIYKGEANTIYIGKIPADTYNGTVLSNGTVRLRIEIKKDSLPFPGIELVQYFSGAYQQTPNWDQRAYFSATTPFDTTITLNNLAPAVYNYAIRYGLDNSSYQSYLYSPQIQALQITFEPGDTLYQHVLIE